MGYWSAIDKNQKRINQLTEKVNELEKEYRHLEKINNLQAKFLQRNERRIDELEYQEREFFSEIQELFKLIKGE